MWLDCIGFVWVGGLVGTVRVRLGCIGLNGVDCIDLIDWPYWIQFIGLIWLAWAGLVSTDLIDWTGCFD